MDNMTGYYKLLAEKLETQKDVLLNKFTNLLSLTEAPSRPRQSYRMPDGSYVDEFGTPINIPADQEDQMSPDFVGPRNVSQEDQMSPDFVGPPSDLANPPAQPQPQPSVQDRINQQFDQAAQNEKDSYESSRKKYYARRNQEEKDKAEENLARIATLDMSKMSASGRAQVAVNKLKAERALKRDRFDAESIDRMAASDRAERFMTPEQKAARAERTRAGAAALSAEAEKRYGPGGGVGTIDRRGDNKIQGTSMTFNQFKERYGRDYNALNKDDSNLVRGAASNFAVGRVSQSAQQAAQTADAMNQAYSAQNADLAQRSGAADRAVDASQIELDRFRNDPQYREQLRRAEMDKVRPGVEAEQRVRDEESARIKAQGDANFAQGVQNQIQQQFNQAGVQARNREAGPGKVGVPSLLAKPGQEPKAPNLISRPEGMAPEAPTLLQAPPPETPAAPAYTGAGSKDYGKPPAGIARPEDATPDLLRRNNTGGIPVGTQLINNPERNVGGQVTQRAATMNTQPLTGRVAPAAPAAPRQPLGATITPARQQPAPAVNTGGMNATGSINDFDDEQQTGGPAERNRALPQPSATPFAQRPLRGRTVTAAARTFNTRGNATRRLA